MKIRKTKVVMTKVEMKKTALLRIVVVIRMKHRKKNGLERRPSKTQLPRNVKRR